MKDLSSKTLFILSFICLVVIFFLFIFGLGNLGSPIEALLLGLIPPFVILLVLFFLFGVTTFIKERVK